jgi:threonine/homoserine/homoserine lactone efflux protein
MNANSILIFFTASIVLILTPGPDMIYVLTRGISNGQKAGVISAIGVLCGLFIHTFLIACGLGYIVSTSLVLYTIIKYAGIMYLIYLGVKSVFTKGKFSPNIDCSNIATKKLFINGLLSDLLNPKIILFFVAFLPQFVNPNKGNESLQLISFGLFYIGLTAIVLITMGLYSGKIGSWMMRKKVIAKYMNKIAGSIMISLGIGLVFSKRRV